MAKLVLFMPTFFAYALVSLLFVFGPIGMKGGILNSKPRRKKYFPMVLLLSFYIVVLVGSVLLIYSDVSIGSIWKHLINSGFMQKHHITLFIVTSLLLYGTAMYFVVCYGSPLLLVEDFKSFPLLSPVFCFGAPAFWTKSLSTLGMDESSIKAASILSFSSGLFFVAGIVLHQIVKNITKNETDISKNLEIKSASTIVLPSNFARSSTAEKKIESSFWGHAALGIILLGLALLTTVVFNLAYQIARFS